MKKINSLINKGSEIGGFLLIYWKEILFLLVIIVSVWMDLLYKTCLSSYSTDIAEIIIVLLPLVLTILSITLSLPREKIYGIDNTKFRKLRGKSTYSFHKMLIITVIIFVTFTLSKGFNLVLTIWILDVFSVIYLVIFLNQEIPILIHNDKKIQKIIRKNIHNGKDTVSLGYVLKKIDMNYAVQNILLTEGIVVAYQVLKTNNREKNRNYIDYLLSLQNNYLWGYIENHNLSFKDFSSEYQNISILEAINNSIQNINDIINFGDQLNILEIYQDEEHFYHITRSLFSIYRILNELKFDNKFDKEFSSIIRNIFMQIKYGKVNESEKRFLYKIINAMVMNTLSNDAIWFVKILRDSAFGDIFSVYGPTEYMVFVSVYIYYLVELENRVPKEFKEELIEFIAKPSKGLNSNGETWSQVLKHKLGYTKPEDIKDMLLEVLSIYECNSNSFSWYEPRTKGTSWSSTSENSFSKTLLMKWWIGYVLTGTKLHTYMFNNQKTIDLPQLIDEDKDLFAKELNKNWFVDDELNLNVVVTVAKFYGLRDKLDPYMQKSALVKTLKNYKNTHLKNQIKEEIQESQPTSEILDNYKDILISGFNQAIIDLPILDRTIDLEDEEMRYFNIRFDTRWSESLVKSYAKEMPRNISKLIYDDFTNNKKISELKEKIEIYDSENLMKISEFSPTSRNAYIYDYEVTDENQLIIDQINIIPPEEKLWLPTDLFFRNNAITVNIETVISSSFVRRFTPSEINSIIDNDYKLVNGLYKYVEGVDGDRSVLLEREEIFKIVSKKFFYAVIVFKYKVIYSYDDILYFDKD